MAGLDVSWTRDEWTEFLANEGRIKRDKASQIASKLAEQDFQTGKFGSFVEEWQNNWKGCKGILLGIGFKEMDVASFIAALRRHIEKEKGTSGKQTQTITVVANRKRPMCNELVWAVCNGIGVVKTSDRILLTSANIYAYLEKAFRKKLIYRDVIRFLKAKIWGKFQIAIEQLDQNVEDKVVVINQKKQTESEYELWTNHLHIRFIQLFPWINAVLNKCNKLNISYWDSMMDEDQMRQFCDAFIRWTNARNGGQPKMCAIYARHQRELILRLVDAVKKDFAGATHKQPYFMKIILNTEETEPLADFEFTLRNARTQEQLQLRCMYAWKYILIRQHKKELDNYKCKQLQMELDNVDEMARINWDWNA